jgi:hypothetical protein
MDVVDTAIQTLGSFWKSSKGHANPFVLHRIDKLL